MKGLGDYLREVEAMQFATKKVGANAPRPENSDLTIDRGSQEYKFLRNAISTGTPVLLTGLGRDEAKLALLGKPPRK